MKRNLIALCLCGIVFGACCAGCVSRAKSGYISTDDDVYGRSRNLEYTQKSRSVTLMIERMLTDPLFSEKYAAAQVRAGGRRPTISVDRIENNADERGDAVTAQMYSEVITALRKTGKFDLVDRPKRLGMTRANVRAVNDGESSDVIQGIGSYTPADFTLKGELRREVSRENNRTVYHHFANFSILGSADGTTFWSDSIPFAKVDAE